MMRPCIECGEPSDGPRCDAHTVRSVAREGITKLSAQVRGYDGAWNRLSRRARRLQPFCSGCGATEDLQTDHTPEAWERKAAGKAIRLRDVQVLCGPCNRAAGAARGDLDGSGGYPRRMGDATRWGEAKFVSYTPGGYA